MAFIDRWANFKKIFSVDVELAIAIKVESKDRHLSFGSNFLVDKSLNILRFTIIYL